MEDNLQKRGRISKNVKLGAGFIIVILLISLTPAIIRLPIFRPSYHGDVTISPVEVEVVLSMDFYSSEEDARARTNNFLGHSWRLDPSDEEQERGFTVAIPTFAGYVWVKIYFDEVLEAPCNFHCLRVGQMVHSVLLGVELSIYIEPN